jgi:RND superfamily putative drug exporter
MLPTSSVQRQLFQDLSDRFPATTQAPIVVVSRADPAQLSAWGSATVAGLPGVRSVDPVTARGSGADRISVLGVRLIGSSRTQAARDVVGRIRAHRPAFEVWVAGESAQVADFVEDITRRAPIAITVVVLATFVLLFLMTGSVLVPLKALVMNAVSLGASFGVLVWVFQQGHLEGLLQFRANGGIDQTIPALALAFAFGLSMDYEVFLLSRIKELRDAGAGNDEAVRYGLQRSGRIITSAALIVLIVFAGFASGQLLIIKEIGVALTVAVAVDATIVRILLVPATMTLLGEWNWWAPAALRRLHGRFGISEAARPPAV